MLANHLASYCIIKLLQKHWRIVMDHFFGLSNPGALFKCPANVYTFHETVMSSVAFRAKQVTKPSIFVICQSRWLWRYRPSWQVGYQNSSEGTGTQTLWRGYKTRRGSDEEEEEGGFWFPGSSSCILIINKAYFICYMVIVKAMSQQRPAMEQWKGQGMQQSAQ